MDVMGYKGGPEYITRRGFFETITRPITGATKTALGGSSDDGASYETNPKPMKRRNFIKTSIAIAGAVTTGLLARKLYADDLVEDPEILSKLTKICGKFTEIYGKIKGGNTKFVHEETMHINDDNIPDKVKFTLDDEGSVTVGTNVTSGKEFTLELRVSSQWPAKIYGLVGSNGEFSDKTTKSQWLKKEKAKEYLDVVLKNLEKKVE